ncbi:hypothetical protein AN958_03205 [Leucoagaricus sp. SymC.cos]|nr:hypothetical protein AN958_03205 [Leucoagaricus sp. SymC.cos]
MYAISPGLHGVHGWSASEGTDPEVVDRDYGVEIKQVANIAEHSDDKRDRLAGENHQGILLHIGPHNPPTEVACEPLNCPLPLHKIQLLDYYLYEAVNMDSQEVEVQEQQWAKGLYLYEWLKSFPEEAFMDMILL